MTNPINEREERGGRRLLFCIPDGICFLLGSDIVLPGTRESIIKEKKKRK